MRLVLVLALLLTALAAWAQGPAVLTFGDFEDGKAWPGGTITTGIVKSGTRALLFTPDDRTQTLTAATAPGDWTAYDRLSFWCYSEKANNQILTIVANSDDKTNGEDWDYYFNHLVIDWQGWKHITLARGVELAVSRRPLGWNQIQSLSFNTGGWDHWPLKDTRLVFDDVQLTRDVLKVETVDSSPTAGGVTHRLRVVNRNDKPGSYRLEVDTPADGPFTVACTPAALGPVAPGQSAEAQVVFTMKPDQKAEPLTLQSASVEVAPQDPAAAGVTVSLTAAAPLPDRPHPRLYLDAADIARVRERATRQESVQQQLKALVARGEEALKLDVAAIPDHGGQWAHYYVCKDCGFSLKTVDATHHQCPKCGKVYSGWPWDDVVVGNVHSRYTGAVRTLGLAYAFSGDPRFAAKGREILLAYAEKYPTFKLHNVAGGEGASAGRLYAQTLDESCDVIGVAWGYDLMYDAACFTPEDHQRVEQSYLREVCKTIQRNDAGISNWQSWHNAGVAAVGFCLNDPVLAGWAINGKSGLRFQLQRSILPDGFWYEGTAGYHFYALDALRRTVEAAHYAGIDFYSSAAYRSLYEAPLQYTFPDGIFPAINDSSKMSISGQHALYEVAYARFKDPAFAWVASQGKRTSLEATLWGADELPPPTPPKLASKDFNGLGAAVLRVGEGDRTTYLHFDYGPHGGGHGHPDKLVVALWGLGQEFAPDPGCLAYAAALHGSWYRQTFAHNTLVVDERTQVATEGHLKLFGGWDDVAVASGECDTAYRGVHLSRSVVLTPTYLLDLSAAAAEDEHQYDFVWHNLGEMAPSVPVTAGPEPLGKGNGYQHATEVKQGSGAQDWSVDFKLKEGQVRLQMPGVEGTELFFATGMTGRPPVPCPLVVARRHGKTAAFTSLVDFAPDKLEVTALRAVTVTVDGKAADPARTQAYRLSRGEGNEDLIMLSTEQGTKRIGEFTTEGRFFFARIEGGKVVTVKQLQ